MNTKGGRTKKNIYDCANKLFREKGYHNVSVSEIVQRAGVAKGTFYIYFSSKADIIIHMLEEYDEYYTKLWCALDPRDAVVYRIMAIVHGACVFTEEMIGLDLIKVLYINQLSDTSQSHIELYTNRKLYNIMYQLIEEGIATRVFCPEVDAQVVAERLIRCLRGTFIEWCMKNGVFHLTSECEEYVSTFLHGIQV